MHRRQSAAVPRDKLSVGSNEPEPAPAPKTQVNRH